MEIQERQFIFIPNRVIQKINSAQNLGEYYFDGVKDFNQEVLKANTLTCNPNGTFKWFIPNTNELVIYVNKLILNEPNSINDICKLNFISIFGEGAKVAHDGANESNVDAADKPTQPNGGGLKGEDAEHGKQGQQGQSFDMPTLYVLYNEIIFVKGVGGVNRGLLINGDGINGGNGARGGSGGDGGNGSRGKDGSSNSLGMCTGGPGVGASGGNAGSGGKGGKAGKGGNGINIYFLGPDNKSNLFKIKQDGGIQGQPGQPGFDGRPGKRGTFGTKPSACLSYPLVSASYWNDGILVPNQEKMIGETNVGGIGGINYYSNDYNEPNPFLINNEISLKKGKYITPSDLESKTGFKKPIEFDFDNILISLNEFYDFKDLTIAKQETYENFINQLDIITKSLKVQGKNIDNSSFKFIAERVLPIGKKFYNNSFFIVKAELQLEDEIITEIFESYFVIEDRESYTISNYSKFLFNSEYYTIEKNIIGHQLEKLLIEKLKY